MYNARIAGCPGRSLNNTHDFNSCACRFDLTIGAPCGTLLASVSQHTFSQSGGVYSSGLMRSSGWPLRHTAFTHFVRRRGSDSRYIPISVFEARSHSACVLFRTFVVSPTAASLSQYHVMSLVVEDSAGWQTSVPPLFPSVPCVSNRSVHVHSC